MVLTSSPCSSKEVCVKLWPGQFMGSHWAQRWGMAALSTVSQSSAVSQALAYMQHLTQLQFCWHSSQEDLANAMWCHPFVLEGCGQLLMIFFFLAANLDKWPEKWVYCTTLKPSYLGPKISILGYEEMKTISSKVTLASCRWSARCSMACASRSRKCTQRWELILNSLLLIKYYWEFYPHFTLMFHVTLYAFIFTAESKQGDLYI